MTQRFTIIPISHDTVWDSRDHDWDMDVRETAGFSAPKVQYAFTVEGDFDVVPRKGENADMVLSDDVDSFRADGQFAIGQQPDNVTDVVVTCKRADDTEMTWETGQYEMGNNPILNTFS